MNLFVVVFGEVVSMHCVLDLQFSRDPHGFACAIQACHNVMISTECHAIEVIGRSMASQCLYNDRSAGHRSNVKFPRTFSTYCHNIDVFLYRAIFGSISIGIMIHC